MLKSVIFDFDGTLVDSLEVFISAFNKLADKHHYNKIKVEELDHLKSLSIKERCVYLNFPLYKIPFISPELLSLYKQAIKDISFMDGIKEMLTQLHAAGYELAIISSNAEKNIQEFLLHNDIQHISTIMCSNKIFGKHRMITKFLKKKKLDSSQVIYVGDEERDVVASKKSGIKVIWVGWGYDSLEIAKKARPDFVVDQPNEIMSVLESLK
ncbi:HAD-IIIA family hydrolase [Bacillus sp. 03113]|uniref:HAD-IIIA family hydrolase n=1 Tax=Bacillus sp. 03113 TaxID=2578211 RepID=UPI001144D8F0|nr:HAD-IIIA family hydrolase [Bacillus sp. 03113]